MFVRVTNIPVPTPEEVASMQVRRQNLLPDPQRMITIQDPQRITKVCAGIIVILGLALFAVGLAQVIGASSSAWWAAVVIAPVVLILPAVGCLCYVVRGGQGEIKRLPALVARVIQAEQNRFVLGRDPNRGRGALGAWQSRTRENNLDEKCFRAEYLSEGEIIALWPYRAELLRYSDPRGNRCTEDVRRCVNNCDGLVAGSLIERLENDQRFTEFPQIVSRCWSGQPDDRDRLVRQLGQRRSANLSALSNDQYVLLRQQTQNYFYPSVWKDVRSVYFLQMMTTLSGRDIEFYITNVLPTLIPLLKEKFGEVVGAELGKKIGLRLGPRISPNSSLGAAPDPAFRFPNKLVEMRFLDGTCVQEFTHALAKANSGLRRLFYSTPTGDNYQVFYFLDEGGPLATTAITFKEGSTLPRNLPEEDLLRLRQLANRLGNEALKKCLDHRDLKKLPALPPADQKITFTFRDEEPLEVNALVCAGHNRTIAHLINDIHNTTSVPLHIPRRIATIVLAFNPAERLPDDLTLHDYILLADAAEYFNNAQLRDQIVDHFAQQSFASFLEPLREYNQEIFDNYVPNIFERAWNLGRTAFF